MSKTKNDCTPGPWAVSLPDETMISGDDGETIATTFFGDDDYETNYMRRRADAELIVRAVNSQGDMLAALKTLVQWYGKRSGANDDLMDLGFQEPEIANAMRVIAKAEGKPTTSGDLLRSAADRMGMEHSPGPGPMKMSEAHAIVEESAKRLQSEGRADA